jgi:hypothetical protein
MSSPRIGKIEYYYYHVDIDDDDDDDFLLAFQGLRLRIAE